MCCDRVVRLLCQPLLEDSYGLVDLADQAMGKNEQSPRVAVLRPQRERPAEAVRRFLAAAQAIQQDPEVGVGVRVIGRLSDSRPVCGFGFVRPSSYAK